jgi:biopolymer transport protein ExbD
MNFLGIKARIPGRPEMQLVPLIDVLFINLFFFMILSVFWELESEINISVPTAKESVDITRTPGEIIINIRKDGQIVVNQKKLSPEELKDLLVRVSELYKGQSVIIRADKETYHEYVIKVLDICAGVNIWNVSFATLKEKAAE